MPIPTPNGGESEDDFIQRCMGDENMNSDFPDNAQRYAVCQSSLTEEKAKKQMEQAVAKIIDKLT